MQPNNHLSTNSRIPFRTELKVNPQADLSRGEVGRAIVRILNNSTEFCKSLLPFYGAAPCDGKGRIQLQAFNPNQFFHEMIQFVPKLVGDATGIGCVMQLLMMAGAAHGAGENDHNQAQNISSAKASSLATPIASGAIGDATNGCNQAGTEAQTHVIPMSAKAGFFGTVMGGLALGVLGFAVGCYIKAYREGKSGWDLAKAPCHCLGEISGDDCQERSKYSKRPQSLTDVIETDSEEDLVIDIDSMLDDVSPLCSDSENDEEQLRSGRSLAVLSFTTPALDRRVMVEIHRQDSDFNSQIDIEDEEVIAS